MFIGRQSQLDVLEELHDSGRPELFVLYGRRRVGKTELLQQFCAKRKAVYFLAAQVREKDNLRAFRDAMKEGLGDPLLDGIEFPDWGAALQFAAERAGDERLVIVLDEFPYLCEATKGLPSILQRFWDMRGKNSSLMLVLCGSQVSFMEREVLAERSPLFGRRTAQRRLQPLSPTESLRFFDSWNVRERALAYSILGGMPAYLRRFDDRETLRTNLLREMLRPEGYLFDEVQFLLRNELNSPATYNSLLAAIARGHDRVGDIALQVGVEAATAGKYLHVLRELQLVDRVVPITDPDPLRSRRGRYRIADRFLNFHFRHLVPNLSLIEAGRGERVWETRIEPDLENLFDEARVDFVLEHLQSQAAEVVGDEIVEVGRFAGEVVRAVARTASGTTLAALVLPEGCDSMPALERELTELERVFGDRPRKLAYGLSNHPDRPLQVEWIPADVPLV
ncbi:MAG: AAA+ ATPase superfamily predicted ATPase [Planctomycetota bacterium]|jgi:AAA+ ATPase superfamily predicted ATPase